ncbi:phage neck terminator protein [Yokenella regensburgei]|uniref:phage neck terminator protein n=1 Tax=Yokenella regensburgei TaxID=158877 RepID=UPI003ED88045
MNVSGVNLLTAAGVILYPSYREEVAEFDENGNVTEVEFTAYDGDAPQTVVAVTISGEDEPVSVPVNIILAVGTVIKFPPQSLTTEAATPVVLRGAPYYAAVRARQMLVELMGTENAAYALQSMPQPKDDFAIAYVTSHTTSTSEIDNGFDEHGRWYDFNAWAEVTIIRSSATALQYLHDLLTVLETWRGYYWQFERGFDLVRSQEVSNSSPLINNLGYQQQAEVAISFSFVHRHYEQEGWIARAEVNDDMVHVDLIREGE